MFCMVRSKMSNKPSKVSFFAFIFIIFTWNFAFDFVDCAKYADYDFPEADTLFFDARFRVHTRKVSGEWNKESDCDMPDPKPTQNSVFRADSPIGYEVPCGIRGGSDMFRSNLNYESRMAYGIKAHPGEFPWQVSLQLVSGWFSRHICGGTVLSSYWVVTAGHCVHNLKPKALLIVAGDHDIFVQEGTEQWVYVVRIVTTGYNEDDFSSDIALLQVNPPLQLDGKRVSPICLPNPTKEYSPGQIGLVSGWGKLSENGRFSNILHFVHLPIISIDNCAKLYEDVYYGRYINKCQLCCGYDLGGSYSCQGDSGGPVVCRHDDKRYYLCGIVSWGVGCARPNLPGVYTKVSCYSSWIKSVLYNVDDIVSRLPSH